MDHIHFICHAIYLAFMKLYLDRLGYNGLFKCVSFASLLAKQPAYARPVHLRLYDRAL